MPLIMNNLVKLEDTPSQEPQKHSEITDLTDKPEGNKHLLKTVSDVKHYQGSIDLLIPPPAFKQVLRDIANEQVGEGFKWSRPAISAC